MVSAEHLYQMLILEHAKDSKNIGQLTGEDVYTIHERNNSCGDDLMVYLKISDRKIVEMKYEISGCILSKAATSIMVESLVGKNLIEVKDVLQEFSALMTGNEDTNLNRELKILQEVVKFPVRIKCVMMPFKAVEKLLLEVN